MPIRPPKRLGMLGFGLLAGMTSASLEILWSFPEPDGALLAHGLIWYGLLGAAYFALAGEMARLAIQRQWYSATYSTRPVLAGGLLSLGLPAAALYQFAHLLAEQLPTTRLILFFMLLACSGLAGWCLARAMAARPGIWLMRLVRFGWRPGLAALCLLLALGLCSWKILTKAGGAGLVLASDIAPTPAAGADLIWIQIRGLGPRAGLGQGDGSSTSMTPYLDGLASKGVVFSSASERAWPSIPWPWPLSLLEPWLRPAAIVDPELATIEPAEMALILQSEGFRCLALGGQPAGLEWMHPERARHQRRADLWLSKLIGRGLGAMGLGSAPRPAPAWEASLPFQRGAAGAARLAQGVRSQAWPSREARNFLVISMELPEGGLAAADRELGELLEQLRSDGQLEQALLVLCAWVEASDVTPGMLPRRLPLILVGGGLVAGQRVNQPVSLRQLPALALALLGLESTLGSTSGHKTIQALVRAGA